MYFAFLAFAMYPAELSRVQAEIDSVIGNGRLPSMADRAQLPHTEAFIKEVHRFHTVGPTNVPHRLVKDDVYSGYFFPKGSIVLANNEGMHHDYRTYRDPRIFDPARFLPEITGRPAEQNSYTIGFGFGRRKCPGIKIAEANVFLTCAIAAAVFDIRKPIVDGQTVDPIYEKLPGGICHAKPFAVAITPRSKKAEALLRGE
jgi:cytochrome P450